LNKQLIIAFLLWITLKFALISFEEKYFTLHGKAFLIPAEHNLIHHQDDEEKGKKAFREYIHLEFLTQPWQWKESIFFLAINSILMIGLFIFISLRKDEFT